MAALELLPGWLGSSAAWFVILNAVVAAIAVLSTRARAPPSPSGRRPGGTISSRASSAVLQRLMSSSIFSFPSACFNTWPATPTRAAAQEAEGPGTPAPAWKQPTRPSTPAPRAAAAAEPDPQAEYDEEEEDPSSMSMEEVYALVLAGRQQSAAQPPTEEEARRSEVSAKAEEFIRGFKEDERQQRLDSIANYTQMLRDRALAVGRRRRVEG